MCSVFGCGSWRRSAPRFKLPDDPEKRLEWVQFLFEVNRQRFKESSWTDITICSEHFTEDCFDNRTGTVQPKPGAVPSQRVRPGRGEPGEGPPRCVEPVETTDVACQCDDFETCNIPAPHSENSKLTSTDEDSSGCDHMQHYVVHTDLNKEKVVLHQVEGKFVVNESCLLQLFPRTCPSCGCKLQMEKVTCGVLIILNQQCVQCEYRNQWKSQVNGSVPATEDHHPTGDTEVTPADEGEEGDEDEVSSDGVWNPAEDSVLAQELPEDSEDETDDEGKEEKDLNSPSGLKINELCTECGSFFSIQKSHVCEHKIKPYSCNICGKRCVTEMSLKNHSVTHDETYEHPCRYCHVTFNTRLEKLKHELIHQDRKDPYKCPDCPQTFATNGERRVHLANHRTQKEFKCGVCGMEFKDVHHLRRHSVVHTGLKPYKCSVCQRGFNQGSHLKSHMRLHTGERPFKCQQCDKCFNHKVSLKSHVQRYHSQSSGSMQRSQRRASDTGDADDDGDERGAESDSENVEEQDTEEEVQRKIIHLPKSGKRCTGRPVGRPKRDAVGSLVPGRKEDQCSNTKKLKRTGSGEEESEDEQSDSNTSFDSPEEEQDTEKKKRGRTRRRLKKQQ